MQVDSLQSEPPRKPKNTGVDSPSFLQGIFLTQSYLFHTILDFSSELLNSESLDLSIAFLVAQMVKNPPAMQETWVRSLGWEGPLEEGMATHSSILAWRISMETCLQGNNVDLSIGE